MMNGPGKLRVHTTHQCQGYHSADVYYHFYEARLEKNKRCPNVPTVIITQREPDPDGHHGTMSLCDVCLDVKKLTLPPNFFTVENIPLATQLRTVARQDRLRRGLTRSQARDETRGTVGRVQVGPDLRISRDRPAAPPPAPRRSSPRPDRLDLIVAQRLQREADPFSQEDDDFDKLLD